jgi:hypothetical protein
MEGKIMKKWLWLAVAISALPGSAIGQASFGGITGQDVPDSAAALYFLDARSEPPPHSERFVVFIRNLSDPSHGSLFQPGDAAVLQTALESYYATDQENHAAYLAEAEGYAAAGDIAALSNLQNAYITQRIVRANNTIALVSAQMGDKGAALAQMLQDFKEDIALPSNDPTIAYDDMEEGIIRAQPASMHSHAMPQGTSMGFSYGSWYTVDAVISLNADYRPYGTMYFSFGMEGTTNPCTGSCVNATHTAQMQYNHAASGKGTQTFKACAGPAYDVMGSSCGHTYSWSFSGDGINNDDALLQLLCTIAGVPIFVVPIPLLNNPANCPDCHSAP